MSADGTGVLARCGAAGEGAPRRTLRRASWVRGRSANKPDRRAAVIQKADCDRSQQGIVVRRIAPAKHLTPPDRSAATFDE